MKNPEQVKSYKQLSDRVASRDVRRSLSCDCSQHKPAIGNLVWWVRLTVVLASFYTIISVCFWVYAQMIAARNRNYTLFHVSVSLPAFIFLWVLEERLSRRRWVRLHERLMITDFIPSYLKEKIVVTRERLVGRGSRLHKLVRHIGLAVVEAGFKKKFVGRFLADFIQDDGLAKEINSQNERWKEYLLFEAVQDKLDQCEQVVLDYCGWQRTQITLLNDKFAYASSDTSDKSAVSELNMSVMRELWVVKANEVFCQLHALQAKFEQVCDDYRLTKIEDYVRLGTDSAKCRGIVDGMLSRLKESFTVVSHSASPAETGQKSEKNLSA